MSSLTAEFAASDDGQERNITQKGVRLVFLPFAKIRPYRGHPFRLYTGERLDDMVESIRQNGILMPLIVRRIFEDAGYDYEMLSGHNRMNAGQIAGLDGAWCVVKEGLSDAESLMYVIETNLLQRSFADLLPSEKAAVLSMRYSEMFSQGKRNDILRELKALEGGDGTCGTEFQKFNSRDVLGDDYDLSGRQVAKYLRINPMHDNLKLLLDGGLLTLNAAVSLSHLNREDQLAVYSALTQYHRKPSDSQIAAIRQLAETKALAQGNLYELLHDRKSSTPPSISIKRDTYSQYFSSGTPKKEIERVIGEALALYFGQKGEESA